MATDAVKIARINAQKESLHSAMAFTLELVKNPIVELLGGIWILAALQEKASANQPEPKNKFEYLVDTFAEGFKEGAMGATLAGIIVAQQLAPYAGDIIRSGSDALGVGTKALALLK